MFMFVYDDDHDSATFGKTKREALDKWLQEIDAKIEDIEPDLCQFWAPVPSTITTTARLTWELKPGIITQTVKQMVTYEVE